MLLITNNFNFNWMHYLVRNLEDTSDLKPDPPYESWKEFWEDKTQMKADKCSHCKCKENIVGAHVEMAFGDNNYYIIPLCKKCNKFTGDFFVETKLVRTNKK